MSEPSSPLRVYYLSSGRLGRPVLETLLDDRRINLLGIGSQPDKRGGRNKLLIPTPVSELARARGRDVDQVVRLRTDEELIARLQALDLDFLIVASFGQILPQRVLDIPRHGCFNVHASLLPLHRGASPIAQAILDGCHQTGVSFMRMDKGCDTGPVYRQLPVDIAPNDTTPSLEDKLAQRAADAIVDTLLDVAAGRLAAIPQDSDRSTYASKIAKADGAIDWNLPADVIERRIRAYTPWPTVYMAAPSPDGKTSKRLQLIQAEAIDSPSPNAVPGTFLSQDRQGIVIACAEGALRLKRVVPEGRKAMAINDFLRGNPLPAGTIFSNYPVEA